MDFAMKNNFISFEKKMIEYQVIFTKRKTIQIAVHLDCKIVVTAPVATKSHVIKAEVFKRGRWIQKKLDFFKQFPPRIPKKYCDGEYHSYLGKSFILRIEENTYDNVKLDSKNLTVFCKDQADRIKIQRQLTKWYREKAEIIFADRLNYFVAKFPEFQKRNLSLKIRIMKASWGTLSQRGVVTLNLNLIKAPMACIDYVIVHELCHLWHRHHNAHFYQLLEKIMPDYRQRKHKLEISLT